MPASYPLVILHNKIWPSGVECRHIFEQPGHQATYGATCGNKTRRVWSPASSSYLDKPPKRALLWKICSWTIKCSTTLYPLIVLLKKISRRSIKNTPGSSIGGWCCIYVNHDKYWHEGNREVSIVVGLVENPPFMCCFQVPIICRLFYRLLR